MSIPIQPTSVTEIKDIVIDSSKFLTSLLKNDYQNFSVKYNFALNEYYDKKIATLSKMKVFLSTDVVDLHDIYIEQSLQLSERKIPQSVFLRNITDHKRTVINATAGAGKSCLLKSMFLEIIREKHDVFPLFLELRKVNEDQCSILDALVKDIGFFNNNFNSDNLIYILKRRNTLLILDGFDEINYDLKPKFTQELNRLSEHYPELSIIVSSRPESNLFDSWALFDIAQIEPLTLNQSMELISKINYDDDTKNRFTNELETSLYGKHKSFTSNPLLLMVMLFTYEQFGGVPDKVHIFYEQAYQCLFHRHDVTKQGYKRKSLTKLDIKEFKEIFSLFCLASYCKNQFSFKENQLIELLEKCTESKSLDSISSEDLKIELISHVPLLLNEGLDYIFIHRSFQEYFTALYLSENNVGENYFSEALKNIRTDNVAPMLFDMNQQELEKKWILPNIENILEILRSKYDINTYVNYLSLFLSIANFTKDEFYAFGKSTYFLFLEDLEKKYKNFYCSCIFDIEIGLKINEDNIDNLNKHFTQNRHIDEDILSYTFTLQKLTDEQINVLYPSSTIDVDFLNSLKDSLEELKIKIEQRHKTQSKGIDSMIFGD